MNAKPALLWLAEELGIDREDLTVKENFDARMKLQKASFLLHHMGVSPFSWFHFNLYLRGPYSSSLATQYYDFNGDRPEAPALDGAQADHLRWFATLDLKEMEVATSIMLIQEWNRTPMKDDDIYSVLTVSKPWVTAGVFEGMVGQLRKRSLAS